VGEHVVIASSGEIIDSLATNHTNDTTDTGLLEGILAVREEHP
jgi:hypothetical protein